MSGDQVPQSVGGGLPAEQQPAPLEFRTDDKEAEKEIRQLASGRFGLVISSDESETRLETFPTMVDMLDRMEFLDGTPVSVVPFFGLTFRVSKGPHRYLITPVGMFPLFRLPDEGDVEIEPTGFLGSEKDFPFQPPVGNPPTADVSDQDQEKY